MRSLFAVRSVANNVQIYHKYVLNFVVVESVNATINVTSLS